MVNSGCMGVGLLRRAQVPEGELPQHPGAVADLPGLPAGFGVRLVAAVLDFLILAVPFAVFVSFLSVAMGIPVDFLKLNPETPPSEILLKFGPGFLTCGLCFYLVSGWAYFALCESSRLRGTPGKLLFGLYVADHRGQSVSFGLASLRFLFGRLLLHAPVAGYYYFLVDCLCVGILPGKRAIHDRLSGCFVLKGERKRPMVAQGMVDK
jgi:uncharacterized RDD family membrane protein YckC